MDETMKRYLKIITLGTLAISSQSAWAQQNFDNVEIEVLPVRDGIYMLVGEGGNITVQTGPDGVLLVDTQYAELGEKIFAKITELSPTPIRYIVNTHSHPDHVGGNAVLAPKGSTITGGNVARLQEDAGEGAQVIAFESVLNNMVAEDYPVESWPSETFFVDRKDLYFNGEGIEVLHQPNAHTDGDVIVWFRKSDVVSTGDVFTTTMYPFIDKSKGGSINGVIAALNTILDITIPRAKQEGGTLVIPGHGRLADEADVVEYRDMVTIIRDRIKSLRDRGMSLEEVKASQPTRDYDSRYGRTDGFWTTDMFIEAVYDGVQAN
jgi:cyclase